MKTDDKAFVKAIIKEDLKSVANPDFKLRTLERIKKEQEEKELMKGDEDKVADMIKDFEAIKTKYTFRSQKNNKKYSEVKTLIDKVINHIKK